jgi:hypothetical protein
MLKPAKPSETLAETWDRNLWGRPVGTGPATRFRFFCHWGARGNHEKKRIEMVVPTLGTTIVIDGQTYLCTSIRPPAHAPATCSIATPLPWVQPGVMSRHDVSAPGAAAFASSTALAVGCFSLPSVSYVREPLRDETSIDASNVRRPSQSTSDRVRSGRQ